MTLIVTGPGFWHNTPFSARANELVKNGNKIGTVHTDKAKPKLVCNTCGYKGDLPISETKDNFGWGECPKCNKPYIVAFT